MFKEKEEKYRFFNFEVQIVICSVVMPIIKKNMILVKRIQRKKISLFMLQEIKKDIFHLKFLRKVFTLKINYDLFHIQIYL